MSVSSVSSSVTVASRLTGVPSATVRSSPAMTVGGVLVLPVTVTSSMRQLLPFSNTALPDAVTLALYVSTSGTLLNARVDPVISKSSEAPPDPIP